MIGVDSADLVAWSRGCRSPTELAKNDKHDKDRAGADGYCRADTKGTRANHVHQAAAKRHRRIDCSSARAYLAAFFTNFSATACCFTQPRHVYLRSAELLREH